MSNPTAMITFMIIFLICIIVAFSVIFFIVFYRIKTIFKVGDKEIHEFFVKQNLTPSYAIFCDGKLIKRLGIKYSSLSSESFKFSVGDTEKHEIKVQLQPYFFRKDKLTVLLDGKALNTPMQMVEENYVNGEIIIDEFKEMK